ncbi:transcriptional regulator, XRE family [Desulfatibacillum aliphaticivorans]|uniref:Transcriptional regulator, XRE family n=1 Tax=Desulfatibacillum aliphaticivorans TaxID=218208 RepID=B8FKW4_DESAL|nr:helix-turn-helix transcriptional regulator [Desulfatibacillum aliphaticivorans]ACL04486.1 transcriptional regulator, XRE family [Desulfatibacillum aliphaticivorans]
MMNFELFKTIRKQGLRQKDLAKKVGRSESEVSQVVNGKLILDNSIKAKYAKALNCTIPDIFPEQ